MTKTFLQNSQTPLHFACMYGKVSACQLLCALDGVDQNAVDNEGKTALDVAIGENVADCVRALLELNVNTSNSVVNDSIVEIVQLLDEHRKRSVKEIISLIEKKIKLFFVILGN